jgi:hypothetical protein
MFHPSVRNRLRRPASLVIRLAKAKKLAICSRIATSVASN